MSPLRGSNPGGVLLRNAGVYTPAYTMPPLARLECDRVRKRSRGLHPGLHDAAADAAGMRPRTQAEPGFTPRPTRYRRWRGWNATAYASGAGVYTPA
jgi:hypothetical protein